MKYSISTGFFYDPAIHLKNDIPGDAVDVTDDEFKILTVGRNARKVIFLDTSGRFQLRDPDPIVLTREEVEALRLKAYANIITGSDRYFSEAQRMEAMGEVGWLEVRKKAIARFVEIQLSYPWPLPDVTDSQ